jgi:hypothetical protein
VIKFLIGYRSDFVGTYQVPYQTEWQAVQGPRVLEKIEQNMTHPGDITQWHPVQDPLKISGEMSASHRPRSVCKQGKTYHKYEGVMLVLPPYRVFRNDEAEGSRFESPLYPSGCH